VVLRTYLNLASEKREAITSAAFIEFAARGYNGGSLDRIAASSGISKGALYRYFRDKEDFFNYLVDETIKSLKARIDRLIVELRQGEDKIDFKAGFREIFARCIQWGKDFPLLMNFFTRSIFCPEEACAMRLVREFRSIIRPLLELIFEIGIRRGELRADFNRDAAAFVIYISVGHFLAAVGDAERVPFLNVKKLGLETAIDDLAEVIMNGIKKKP
jgi:AcrR family transcriptional regulator